MNKFIIIGIAINCLLFKANSQERTISRALAEIAIDTPSESITEDAIKATQKALIDVYGVSYAGFNTPGVREIIEQQLEWGGNPQSTIWIDGTKIDVPDAAFANSILIHALDLDDIHLPSSIHITSVIIPAAIAVGEQQEATGKEVIDAIILGIEVAGRLGREYSPRREHGGFLPTSVIGGFGATAASCRLLGLTVEQTIDAFGIFYAHASGNRQALYERTLTKRIQPAIACRAGVVAAYLASKGISGPQNIFLSEVGLFTLYGADKKPFPTVEDIKVQKDYYEVEKISYKKFASCGAGHPVILAAIELSEKYNLKLENIDKIELFILPRAMVGTPWVDSKNPHVLAQFCSPYQVVTAIKNHRQGPHEIDIKTIENDNEVYEMAEKVILRASKENITANPNTIVIT